MASPTPMHSVLLLLAALPGAASLHLVFGAHNIPHPSKAVTGGEDAFFFDDNLGTFGIADGVGGSARDGVDPGEFSREILMRCHMSSASGAVPKVTDALKMASEAPLTLRGSTTLLLGQLDAGSDTLRLLNLGDSGALLLRPSLRSFGDNQEHKVLFPRCVLKTEDQSHFWNCPFQANAKNFGKVNGELDEILACVKEGDVLIAATDGVLDNLFDSDMQACVSDQLTTLMGTDPIAAQEAIDTLSRKLAEQANAIGMRQGEAGLVTPFVEAASLEGMSKKGGKLDDVALVCAVVRDGERPAMRLMHNFKGASPVTQVQEGAAGRGLVVPTSTPASKPQLEPEPVMMSQPPSMPEIIPPPPTLPWMGPPLGPPQAMGPPQATAQPQAMPVSQPPSMPEIIPPPPTLPWMGPPMGQPMGQPQQSGFGQPAQQPPPQNGFGPPANAPPQNGFGPPAQAPPQNAFAPPQLHTRGPHGFVPTGPPPMGPPPLGTPSPRPVAARGVVVPTANRPHLQPDTEWWNLKPRRGALKPQARLAKGGQRK